MVFKDLGIFGVLGIFFITGLEVYWYYLEVECCVGLGFWNSKDLSLNSSFIFVSNVF